VLDKLLGDKEGQVEGGEADRDDDQQDIEIAGDAVEPPQYFLDADTRQAVHHRAAFLITESVRASVPSTTEVPTFTFIARTGFPPEHSRVC